MVLNVRNHTATAPREYARRASFAMRFFPRDTRRSDVVSLQAEGVGAGILEVEPHVAVHSLVAAGVRRTAGPDVAAVRVSTLRH